MNAELTTALSGVLLGAPMLFLVRLSSWASSARGPYTKHSPTCGEEFTENADEGLALLYDIEENVEFDNRLLSKILKIIEVLPNLEV